MVEVLGISESLLDLSKAGKLNLSTDSFECIDKNCRIHNHNHFEQETLNTGKLSYNATKRSSLLRLDEVSDMQLDYKSGAVYNGKMCDNLKYGKGTFSWPNGDKYIGEFKLNFRHGIGKLLLFFSTKNLK